MVDILLVAGIHWLFLCSDEISNSTTAAFHAIPRSDRLCPPALALGPGAKRLWPASIRRLRAPSISLAAPRIDSRGWEELTMPERVEIIGPATERYVEI